jgi:hypothetical protein
MSFIASASDSLISPVNAVNGQTLTWNATTGQFEPANSSSFVGSNGTIAGSSGAVPAPAIADNTKFLKGDGTWAAITTLPNLTDLRGLRGDGTGVPVADARLQYGAANASTIDFNLNGSAGIRLSSVGGNNLITNAGTPNGSPLTIRTQDSAAGLNNFPGNLNLSTGSGTGNAAADIVFSTCIPTVSGTTVTNPAAAWTMGQDAFAATLTANRVGGGGIIQAAFNEQLNMRTLGTGSLAVSPVGSGSLDIGAAGTGAIGIGASTKTTTISGIVKRPTMAFLRTSATANTTVAANTNTIIAFPAALTNGAGISVAASTFTLARTGFYSIKLKVSFQSATPNVRGVVSLQGSTAIFAGDAPQKAFRTANLTNVNWEIEAAWDVWVTTAGNFTVTLVAAAAGIVNRTSSTTATATTTDITILEIG